MTSTRFRARHLMIGRSMPATPFGSPCRTGSGPLRSTKLPTPFELKRREESLWRGVPAVDLARPEYTPALPWRQLGNLEVFRLGRRKRSGSVVLLAGRAAPSRCHKDCQIGSPTSLSRKWGQLCDFR